MTLQSGYSAVVAVLWSVAMSRHSLPDLLALMQRLRAECPWDRVQTPQSLSRYAIEEAYEVDAAIRDGDSAHIRDELGDLLLQVVFQACMYEEAGQFNFADVVDTLAHKLIRRHPHVFADTTAADAMAVNTQWEQIKQHERGGVRRRLDEVKAGPALMQAQQLQKQAAKLGFDWPDVDGARDKLHEELAELDHAIHSGNVADIEDELGDCLFALVNVARKLNIQSETAVLGTVHKFRSRFAYIEDRLAEQGKTPEQSTLSEMDALWDAAKIALRTPAPVEPS
jgi:MazG family protein